MFQRWTRIELSDTATLPPLHEPVMLYAEATPQYRGWVTFHDEAHRFATLLKSDWSHWREEMTVDSP